MDNSSKRLVVGISGATGVIYGLETQDIIGDIDQALRASTKR